MRLGDETGQWVPVRDFLFIWNKKRAVRWLQYGFLFFTAMLCGRIAANIVYFANLSQY